MILEVFSNLGNPMILDRSSAFIYKSVLKTVMISVLSCTLIINNKAPHFNSVTLSKYIRLFQAVKGLLFLIQKNAKNESNFTLWTPCDLFNKEMPLIGLGTLEDSLFITHTKVAFFYKTNKTSVSVLHHCRFLSSLVANVYTHMECYVKNSNVSHCSETALQKGNKTLK